MSRTLSTAERQALKARAHGMRPVVMIGTEGVTEGVVRELDAALRAHELVKVRVLEGGRGDREAMLAAMCAASGASPVQHIGKVLVLFREKPATDRADDAPGSRPASGRPADTAKSRRLRAARSPAAAGKRWTFIREEGRPGHAPKRPSKGRKAVRRLGGPRGRGR